MPPSNRTPQRPPGRFDRPPWWVLERSEYPGLAGCIPDGMKSNAIERFNHRGRRCLSRTGRHQRYRDAGGLPSLARREDEDSIDRCPPGGWLFVCDPVLHYGLQHELETCWFGDNRPSAHVPRVAHCACSLPRAPAAAENTDRTILQAALFVPGGARHDNFHNFIRASF